MTEKTVTLDREAILRDTIKYWRDECAERDVTIVYQRVKIEQLRTLMADIRDVSDCPHAQGIARAALEATKEPQS